MILRALIARAADLIDKNCWWSKGRSQGPQSMCAVDALRAAVREQGTITDAELQVIVGNACNVIATHLKLPPTTFGSERSMDRVVSWNDRPDQTQTKVTTALREIARA